MKRVYVASPYTYKGPKKTIFHKLYARYFEWKRFIEITRIQGRLVAKYDVACYGPITESHLMVFFGWIFGEGLHKASGVWSDWRDYDLCMIDGCDELWCVMMDGFDRSTGVQSEIRHCNMTGKPVRYLDPKTLEMRKTPKGEVLSSQAQTI